MKQVDGALKVAICDDEELQLNCTQRSAEALLSDIQAEICTFTRAHELLNKIECEGYLPDIAILDIDMPDIDGIEMARELNRSVPACQIIFLTNYLNYATEVYDTSHTYFVLKSQLSQKLEPALGKALRKLREANKYVVFKSGRAVSRLPAGEIIYIERELHKTRLITLSGEYSTTQPPDKLLNISEGKSAFIHCHQSFWVNAKAIATMEANSFVMSDGTEIPISRARKEEARKSFFEYITRDK